MSPTATARPDAEGLDVARIVERVIARNVKGLNYFTSLAPPLGETPKDVIYQRGTLNLYHYRPMADEIYRIPVLIVMATTNRGYILDLARGESFIEFLLKSGYDVFMIDWSAPTADERTLRLEDYTLDFIPECVRRVRELSGEQDVTVAGYCMGGVLSTMWAALHPDDQPANLVCFTTPVDFSKMTLFSKWQNPKYFDVDRLVDTLGNVPSDMILSGFEMLRPASRIAGQVQLWDNMWNDDFVQSFRRFERWSQDTLPLAGEYFRQTTKELVWGNKLFENTLEVGGRRVDLKNITAPIFHAVAEHDHIVPYDCAKPLVAHVGSADREEVVLKGGHVSLVAGRNAVTRLWPRLDRWLSERSA